MSAWLALHWPDSIMDYDITPLDDGVSVIQSFLKCFSFFRQKKITVTQDLKPVHHIFEMNGFHLKVKHKGSQSDLRSCNQWLSSVNSSSEHKTAQHLYISILTSWDVKVHTVIRCMRQTNWSPHPPAAAFIRKTKSGCGSLPADSQGRGWKVD